MAPDRQSRSNRRIFLDEIAWCFLRTHATVKQATKMLRRQIPNEAVTNTENQTVDCHSVLVLTRSANTDHGNLSKNYSALPTQQIGYFSLVQTNSEQWMPPLTREREAILQQIPKATITRDLGDLSLRSSADWKSKTQNCKFYQPLWETHRNTKDVHL